MIQVTCDKCGHVIEPTVLCQGCQGAGEKTAVMMLQDKIGKLSEENDALAKDRQTVYACLSAARRRIHELRERLDSFELTTTDEKAGEIQKFMV